MEIKKLPIAIEILEEYLQECENNITNLREYRLPGDEKYYEKWADERRSTKIVLASLKYKFEKYRSITYGN